MTTHFSRVKPRLKALIRHQGVICCVAFDRFSLRRITYTPQSALLGVLHLTPCWCPGLLQNPLPLLIKWKFDGGFWQGRINYLRFEKQENPFLSPLSYIRVGHLVGKKGILWNQ
jgi:hypothetical protein